MPKETIDLYVNKKWRAVDQQNTPQSLCFNSRLGVEIELENIVNEHGVGIVPPMGWDAHVDQSLRNNGMEFIFSRPYSGEEVVMVLNYFRNFIKDYKPLVSARTSTHIHVDVTDMGVDELKAFFVLYVMYEDLIFKAYSPERMGNHFCVPISQSDMIIGLCRKLNYPTLEVLIGCLQLGDGYRYCALNPFSMITHGSLEFRHFQATFDMEKMVELINLVLSFKKFALTYKGNLADLFTGASHIGLKPNTYNFFPKNIADKLTAVPDAEESILKGVRLAQTIITHENSFVPLPATMKKEIRKSAVMEEAVHVEQPPHPDPRVAQANRAVDNVIFDPNPWLADMEAVHQRIINRAALHPARPAAPRPRRILGE